MNAGVKLDSDNPVQLVRGYEVIIGFETHAQLATRSKIFSRSATTFGAEPNTQACAYDMALPGVLPVMNQKAVEYAMRFGLAVDAHVAERSQFARKNYFYPDLPKGYQTSQMDLPVVVGGQVVCFVEGKPITVRLVRAHLEEDAGKSLHEDFVGQSGIDLNRAGIPLLEIVTEPDLRSSEQAVAYAKELHKIVTWTGICDGNMQEGSFRCDANVSVRLPDAPLGTRREIKNLNSFRNMQQAIDYEIQWQIDRIEDGYAIEQATVLFDADTGETRAMRSKEDAHDYRYFPCPDLPTMHIGRDWLDAVRQDMPTLPSVLADKYINEYELPAYDANLMTQTQGTAVYFEAAVAASGEPKLCSNWIMGEISKRINADDALTIENLPVTADKLGELIRLVAAKTISNNAARQVFDGLWDAPSQTVEAIVEAKGLKQVNDTAQLQEWVNKAVADNPKMIEQYRAGKDKALNALVGKVMGMSKGKANPGHVMELLKKAAQD